MVIFFIGLEQTAPVFFSCIASYMVVCGSGLFAAIASRGIRKKEPDSEEDPYSALPKKKLYDEGEF